ncbi:hypothetical protein [Ruminococcus flavefaciens]|uniref:P22 coat protein-gene protein 5 n=1 Tax=Ruminococcus flavefaciens TaxID=1265 RepID=A0A315Y2G1_RUMFL|nr:hypothetical protein [Ruminococcus flavefaciens]PWJ14611.1 hypothetical protein IE37_00596 [Ruminococcus flavefaciens]SSA42641.1 hypothetical protein SAMN02910325_00596 [Ruminococcus flavefaciens]
MAHELQARYSDLVLAKLRNELVLSDGFVFNNDYEGDPTSGSVKIPVRDTEVAVSDYDKANGIAPTNGSTSYTDLVINKDKAVNEVIDGYDADSVPDNIVADRLDSAGYSLASQIDTDGGTVLLAGSTATNVAQITKTNIYETIVDIRKIMSKAKIPDDGKRYLLVTPDTMALILKSPEFISASSLGDDVKVTGIVGKIAGFLVKEWNDDTANLAMLAGHPRFATRAHEWQVPIKIQDLSGSGNYIGASAVQGRRVYGHKVLRSVAIRAVYAPGSLTASLAKATGEGSTGKTVATVTAGNTGTTYAYKKNPSERASFDMTSSAYAGTSLTSGTTAIEVSAGDVIEIVNLSSGKVKAVTYLTVTADDIA